MFQVISGRSVQASRLLGARHAVLLETVRGRKSRTDPKAKSKVGRIKVPPPVDPVEMVVLKERFAEYRLITRALRMEFKHEMLSNRREMISGSAVEERMRREVQEHQELMAWNQQENLRMLQLRLVRVQKEQEAAEVKALEDLLKREQEEREFIEEKEKEILQLQEDAKTFITLENLDEKIEEALDNPKNYNFAINKEKRVVKQTVLL